MEHFFSQNSSRDLRSDAHQSQLIGGNADEDHTQIVGGDRFKLLGGDISPILPGFRHHWIHVPAMILSNFDTKVDRAFKM